jgi:hypothetical protein
MEFINKIYNYLRNFFIMLSFRTGPSYEDVLTKEYDDTEQIIFNKMAI